MQAEAGKHMQAGRWSQARGCKQSCRSSQWEAQAASHTCRNAGGQELLSRHTSGSTSRKARTGRQSGKSSWLRQVGMQAVQADRRQLGRQKRQGSTVREVSACIEAGRREGGRQTEAHREKQVRGLQVNTGKPQAVVGRQCSQAEAFALGEAGRDRQALAGVHTEAWRQKLAGKDRHSQGKVGRQASNH
jgi:hypothetical protein